MTTRSIAVVGLLALACGGDLASENPDPYCAVGLELIASGPLEVPSTVVLTGRLVHNDFSGFRNLLWSVTGPEGETVPFDLRDSDGTAIEFVASAAGPYEVGLSGDVSNEACTGDSATINVLVPDALSETYLLRVVRPDELGHARLVTAFGGADFGLGRIEIGASGFTTEVRGMDGALAPASLRFRPASAAVSGLELSTTSGEVRGSLGPSSYEVWVTPYDSSEPSFVYPGFDPLAPPAFIDAGAVVSLSATVTAGGAVSGARVRVAASGGPAVTKSTGASGQASLDVAAGPVDIDVVFPPDTGLPRLFMERSSVPPALSVDAAAVQTRTATFTVESAGGGALPGATVILDGGFDAPVTVDGVATQLPARFTASYVADGSGEIGPIEVPAAFLRAVVTPSGGGEPTVAEFDASGAAPSVLVAGDTATVTGVARLGGVPLPGARIRAAATGVLAGRGGDRHTIAGPDGSYSLALAAGEVFEISLQAAGDLSYASRRIVTTAEDGVVDVDAAPSIRLSGRLMEDGEPVSRAYLAVVDPATGHTVATGISTADGGFTLAIPDPGVE